jgi:hypothetical protein
LVSSFKLEPSLPPSLTAISLLVFKGSWGFDLPHACVDRHLKSICSSCLVGPSAAAAVNCMDICLSLVYIVLVCCWSEQPPIYRACSSDIISILLLRQVGSLTFLKVEWCVD